MSRVETINVPVEGDHGREGPLAWGQRSILATVRWLDPDDTYFNVPLTWPLPGRPGVRQVADAIAALTARHESLRTTLVQHEKPEGGEEWTQRVDRCGSLSVEIHDADGAASVAELAESVARALAAKPFRITEEWPVRWAMIRDGDAVPMVALALSHTAIDNWSLQVMRDDLVAALTADAPEPTPPDRQPLDQAAYEQSDRGLARSKASLDYWERTLAQAPHSLFDYPAAEPEPKRYVRLGLDSPALAVATQMVADACRMSTTTVLLTATACVLSAFTGHDPVLLRLIVANRHDPALRRTVAPLAQDGLILLPAREGTFHDAVKRNYLLAINAYRHSHYEPEALTERIAQGRLSWGAVHDKSAFFNDVRLTDRWESLPAGADAAELKSLQERSRIFEVGAYDQVDCKFFLAVTDTPDTAVLHLLGDTAYLGRDDIAALLRGMESLLVASALGEVPLCDLNPALGIRAVTRPAGWVRTPRGWADPGAIRRLVAEAAGTDEVEVRVEAAAPDRPESRVVAYLAAPPGGISGPDLHRKVVDSLAGRTGAVAPDRYVVCAGRPAAGGTAEEWRARGVLWEGDGR